LIIDKGKSSVHPNGQPEQLLVRSMIPITGWLRCYRLYFSIKHCIPVLQGSPPYRIRIRWLHKQHINYNFDCSSGVVPILCQLCA